MCNFEVLLEQVPFMFSKRSLFIATKHQKELVMAPILESALRVNCQSSQGLDTDILGTFSGEIDRTLSPIEAAKAKCQLALRLCNADLAIANEGSFFPHPMVPFFTISEEIIYLFDQRNNFEFFIRHRSERITAFSEHVTNDSEVRVFLQKTDFPNHNVIVSYTQEGRQGFYKDFSDEKEVLNKVNAILEKGGKEVKIETDLRAMHNPTRMKEIEGATRLFVKELLSQCPACQQYGFVVTQIKEGLPCLSCGLPTSSPKEKIKQCKGCGFLEQEPYDTQKRWEEPQFCLNCNP